MWEVRQQQREFLASDPAQDHTVALSDFTENVRHMPQRRITENVAKLVVDLLKVIDVAHQRSRGATERRW